MLSRVPIEQICTISLGNYRNTIHAVININSNHSNIFGIHLDDINKLTRLAQLNDLTKIINKSNQPSIVLGDFNAMHGDDLWPPKFLRSK